MFFRKIIKRVLGFCVPELKPILSHKVELKSLENEALRSEIDEFSKIYAPFRIIETKIGKGTYLSSNSKISKTEIGKFCSIGPNFLCGWGLHPTNGISTSPYFYSTSKQNGSTISKENLFEERKNIYIGNDTFIGANVTILDGVKIGNGVVIGAGSIVSKDIPDFAIAYGSPIEIKKYRFTERQRKDLKKIEWWNFSDIDLKNVNTYFYNIDAFIEKYKGQDPL
ncbi:CatB-related O-acetyltransferase [Winogradskyella sp. PE311]|uniref:CatB-related O-acetyltransferase n=1 Tax=Winogradskyella sp. PE311 TaxID=3366943 RepID=UPI00397EC428